MKWTDIQDLAREYEAVMYSDEYTEVRPGCDCGCGGEDYTYEDWDRMLTQNAESLAKIKEFCEMNGIEYDGL